MGADADDHENVEYNNSNNTASGDIVRSKFVFQSKFKYLLSELEEIKANERDCKFIAVVIKIFVCVRCRIDCSHLSQIVCHQPNHLYFPSLRVG